MALQSPWLPRSIFLCWMSCAPLSPKPAPRLECGGTAPDLISTGTCSFDDTAQQTTQSPVAPDSSAYPALLCTGRALARLAWLVVLVLTRPAQGLAPGWLLEGPLGQHLPSTGRPAQTAEGRPAGPDSAGAPRTSACPTSACSEPGARAGGQPASESSASGVFF